MKKYRLTITTNLLPYSCEKEEFDDLETAKSRYYELKKKWNWVSLDKIDVVFTNLIPR